MNYDLIDLIFLTYPLSRMLIRLVVLVIPDNRTEGLYGQHINNSGYSVNWK